MKTYIDPLWTSDTESGERKTVQFDGVHLWTQGKDQFIRELIERAHSGNRGLACYLNAHTYNLLCKDQVYRTILSQADIVYPDGKSIVWTVRFLGGGSIERMTGVDFFEDFLRQADSQRARLFFLGGRPGLLNRVSDKLQSGFPGLRIVGTHDGYFDRGEQSIEGLIDRINASQADLLLVGMGSPFQERFAWENRRRIDVPMIWTVGALFDYWAGVERPSPRWLADAGFEWLWRLCQDPSNKWRRYLIGNTVFTIRVGRLMLRKYLFRRGNNGIAGRKTH